MVRKWSDFGLISLLKKWSKRTIPFDFYGTLAKSKHQAIFSTKYLHNTLHKYKWKFPGNDTFSWFNFWVKDGRVGQNSWLSPLEMDIQTHQHQCPKNTKELSPKLSTAKIRMILELSKFGVRICGNSFALVSNASFVEKLNLLLSSIQNRKSTLSVTVLPSTFPYLRKKLYLCENFYLHLSH